MKKENNVTNEVKQGGVQPGKRRTSKTVAGIDRNAPEQAQRRWEF